MPTDPLTKRQSKRRTKKNAWSNRHRPSGCGNDVLRGNVAILPLLGRPHKIINLDPGNDVHDNENYECAVDINDLVCLENVQEELNLGPNGAMMYCLEYLEANLDWLKEKLEPLEKECYLVFDYRTSGAIQLTRVAEEYHRHHKTSGTIEK